MPYTTLISVAELQSLQASGAPLMLFDCSFELGKPETGPRQYREAHIAGAVYAHLDHDLSAKHGVPGPSGTFAASDLGPPASGGAPPAAQPRTLCGLALERGLFQRHAGRGL